MDTLSYYIEEKLFTGKNVIVTGATGGIGSEVVEALLRCGARVTAIVRNEAKARDKFDKLKYFKNTGMFDVENVNLENPIQINKGFKSIMSKYKGRLDVMVFCHGVFKISKMIVTSIESFDTCLNINVRSCFHLISIATPFLKISKGNVVAISSVEAKIPTRDSFLNTLSKAMLNSLLECSALELAPFGVRVNGVAPGMTYTNLRVSDVFTEMENRDYLDKMGGLFPLNKKALFPADVVNTILFLASDDACFMTGEILTVDNGYSLNHDLSFTIAEEA